MLIICMLHDYVKLLDKIKGDDIQYQAYYRNKFMKIADGLAEQIDYDYDLAVERCKKKQEKSNDRDDVGEDGLTHLIRKGFREAKKKEKKSAE